MNGWNDSALDEEIKEMEQNNGINVQLNKDITSGEICKAIKHLKRKKSPGEDKIINEMIILRSEILD